MIDIYEPIGSQSSSFNTEAAKTKGAQPVNRCIINVDQFLTDTQADWNAGTVGSQASTSYQPGFLTFKGASRTTKGFLFDYVARNVSSQTTDVSWVVNEQGSTPVGAAVTFTSAINISAANSVPTHTTIESVMSKNSVAAAVGQVYQAQITVPTGQITGVNAYQARFVLCDDNLLSPANNRIDLILNINSTNATFTMLTVSGGGASSFQTLTAPPTTAQTTPFTYNVSLQITSMSGSSVTGVKVWIDAPAGNPFFNGGATVVFNGALTGTAPVLPNPFFGVANLSNDSTVRTINVQRFDVMRNSTIQFTGLTVGQALTLYQDAQDFINKLVAASATLTFDMNSIPTSVTDSFTKPNNFLSLGSASTFQPWTVPLGASGGQSSYGITSNTAFLSTFNDADVPAEIDSHYPDGTNQVTLAAMTAGDMGGLCVRFSDIRNFWFTNVNHTTNVLTLNKKVANVNSVAGSFTLGSTAASDVVKVVTAGSTIQVFYNGTLRITVTDAFNVGATKHGLFTNSFGVRFTTYSFVGAVANVSYISQMLLPISAEWEVTDSGGVNDVAFSQPLPLTYGGDVWTQDNVSGDNVFYYGSNSPVLWRSPIFQSNFNCITRLVWFLDTQGTTNLLQFKVRFASTSGGIASATDFTISPNGGFVTTGFDSTLQNYFFQVSVTAGMPNNGMATSPAVDFVRLDTYYDPERDTLGFTNVYKIGEVGREIERDLTTIVTQGSSMEFTNQLGFWCEKGSAQGSGANPGAAFPVLKMYRLSSDAAAAAGLYSLSFVSPTSVTVVSKLLNGTTSTSTVTVVSDGVTENTNVVTGMRVVFQSTVAAGDVATIMLGVFFATHTPRGGAQQNYSVYNKEVRILHGFSYPAGMPTTNEMVAAFDGFVNNVQVQDMAATAAVSVSDFTKKAQILTLEKLTTDGSDGRTTGNWFVSDPLATMVGRVIAYAGYDKNPTDGTTPFAQIGVTAIPTFDGNPTFSSVGKPFSTNKITALAFDSSTNTYYAGLNSLLISSTDLVNWKKVLATSNGNSVVSLFLHPTNGRMYIFTGAGGPGGISAVEVWDKVSASTAANQFVNLTSLTGFGFNPLANNQFFDSTNNVVYMAPYNDPSVRLMKLTLSSVGVSNVSFTTGINDGFSWTLSGTIGSYAPVPASPQNILYAVDSANQRVFCALRLFNSSIAGNFKQFAAGLVRYTIASDSVTQQASTDVGFSLGQLGAILWDVTSGKANMVNAFTNAVGTIFLTYLSYDPVALTFPGQNTFGPNPTLNNYGTGSIQFCYRDNSTNINYFEACDGSVVTLSTGVASQLGGGALPVAGDTFQSSNYITSPSFGSSPARLLAVSGNTSNILWEWATEIFLSAISDPATNKANFGNDSVLSDLKLFAQLAGAIQYFDESGKYFFIPRPTATSPVDLTLTEDEEMKIVVQDGDTTTYQIQNQANVNVTNGVAQSFLDDATTTSVKQFGRQTVNISNRWVYSVSIALAIAKFYVVNFDLPKTLATVDSRFLPTRQLLTRVTIQKGFLGLFADSVFLVYKTSHRNVPWSTVMVLRRIVSSTGNG